MLLLAFSLFLENENDFDIFLSVLIVRFQRLEMYGIPVPRYACVHREVPHQHLDYFVEDDDFVEVHGNRFWKPFVEKPVNGQSLFLCMISFFIFFH